MTEILTGDGSSFDDFLRDEGIYVEVANAAAVRVLAWQLREQVREKDIIRNCGISDGNDKQNAGDPDR